MAQPGTQPLTGCTIVVPRARTQAASMIHLLEQRGAEVLAVPTIEFLPPFDPAPMAEAVRDLAAGEFSWVVLTSTNAVDAFLAAIDQQGLDLGLLHRVQVAAVGEKTEKALQTQGIKVDLVPPFDRHNAAGLVEVFPESESAGNKVLLPRADIATDVLPAGLKAKGYEPHHVTAYQTVPAAPPEPEVAEAIRSGEVDAICFTSGSTVRNFLALVGRPAANTVIACIGPMAAGVARKNGLEVHVMATQATVEHMVEALTRHLSQ